MKEVKNRFGNGILYEKEDLGESIYCVCTACMSVWSDFLSFANSEFIHYMNFKFYPKRVGKDITPNFITNGKVFRDTDTIVILGCQVTDLAIYNDIKTAEELHSQYPNTTIYMGGCLAYRFDIDLPDYLKRLEVIRTPYQYLTFVDGFIDYKVPFWNKELKDDSEPLETGNLFRHMYPLKIGAGCTGSCKYCTIKDTRGESFQTDAYLQLNEFLEHADKDNGVVLISDSPSVSQIEDWCHLADRYKKDISFRNVEPHIAMKCSDSLEKIASQGLLKIFHCPIQSNDVELLKEMNRDVKSTIEFITFAQELRSLGVIVATNIIIDYTIGNKVYHNMDEEWLNSHFDYWSWNPYFDGKWDIDKAKERFKKYLGYEK